MQKNKVEIIISAKDKTSKAFKTAGSHMESAKKQVFGLKSAFIGLGVAVGVGGVAKSFLQTGIAAEKMGRGLEAALGSVEAGAEAQKFLRLESERLGLVFENQISDFQKIAAAARGTALEGQAVKDIYTAMAEASTALQLSSAETSGALLAIGQMISKGTVQAEELRGQLGERLPGAFQIAAKAMNVTTAELGKMLEMGKVTAVDFLPKFAEALSGRYKGSVAEASKTAQAQINRLHNAYFEMKKEFMETGALDAFANAVKAITPLVKDLGGQLKLVTEYWVNFFSPPTARDHTIKRIQEIKGQIKILDGELSNSKGMLDFWKGAGHTEEAEKKIKAYQFQLKTLQDSLKYYDGKPKKQTSKKPVIPMQDITVPGLSLGAADFGTKEEDFALFEIYTDKLNYVTEAALNAKQAISQWPVSPGEDYAGQIVDYDKQNTEKFESLNVFLHREKQAKLDQFDYSKFLLKEENEINKKKYEDDTKMLEQWTKTYDAEMGKLKETTSSTFSQEMATAITGWGSHFSSTLNDMLWDADATFGDILESFAKMITQMMIQQAVVAPIMGSFTGWLGGASATASAKGNVFSDGNLVPFAKGGVVTKPVVFPMAQGMGLMGEAGPEAVMPLTRTSGGDLGVKALSSGVTVNVINNTKSEVNVEKGRSGNGRQLIQIVIDEVADNISRGGNVGRTINSTFGLNRAGAVR